VDLTDAILLLSHLFLGGRDARFCADGAGGVQVKFMRQLASRRFPLLLLLPLLAGGANEAIAATYHWIGGSGGWDRTSPQLDRRVIDVARGRDAQRRRLRPLRRPA